MILIDVDHEVLIMKEGAEWPTRIPANGDRTFGGSVTRARRFVAVWPSVSQALRSRGIEVVESDVDSTLLARLAGLNGSVVFPLLHGEAGEDGALREVFELLGVPFVGSVGSACRVAFDKSIATTVVRAGGIRTPTQVALPHETFRELGAPVLVDALGDQIGFPMMIKPSRCGSALGCSKVTRPAELPAAMVGAYAYGSVAVIEEFVTGTEVTVAVVDRGNGPIALPAVEIRPESGVYDYAARIPQVLPGSSARPRFPPRWQTAAPTWLSGYTRSWVFATCRAPTSSSPPTAMRSSSKSMSLPA